MGGMPALGHDVVERKLVANPQESAIIQEMFSRFAATPSMSLYWRRERDSNPRYGKNRIPDFESGAFDHSAISPGVEGAILSAPHQLNGCAACLRAAQVWAQRWWPIQVPHPVAPRGACWRCVG